VVNPKIDLGCAQWCKYAKQCLAVSVKEQAGIMREKLIGEMKNVFGDDRKRVDHALGVLDYAEQIQAIEGGDPLVVKAAAILHDIGIHEAQRKHGSSAGKYQEIEGPVIAREILSKYELDEAVIEHVYRIIANHHSAKDIDTLEFRILWDSDWLVNIPEEFPGADKEKLDKLIDKIFKTHRGHQIAVELFLGK
jgi:putative nucleotidyltransferase with HDIG domain